MAARVVVLSDTHLPRRAKDLPAAVWAAVEAADLVVHAGDWCDAATVLALRSRRARLVGRGRQQRRPGRARAPAGVRGVRARRGCGSASCTRRVPAPGRERRCDAARAGTLDVLLFGHSHVPWDSTTPSGIRLLNPGSPTDRRRMPTLTWLELTVADGSLRDVELRHLPPRAPQPRQARASSS